MYDFYGAREFGIGELYTTDCEWSDPVVIADLIRSTDAYNLCRPDGTQFAGIFALSPVRAVSSPSLVKSVNQCAPELASYPSYAVPALASKKGSAGYAFTSYLNLNNDISYSWWAFSTPSACQFSYFDNDFFESADVTVSQLAAWAGITNDDLPPQQPSPPPGPPSSPDNPYVPLPGGGFVNSNNGDCIGCG